MRREQAVRDWAATHGIAPDWVHRRKLKTNNPMERLLREVRCRAKVVGAFPDGNSALMLVAARLRHVSATSWGLRIYMNIKLIDAMDNRAISAA